MSENLVEIKNLFVEYKTDKDFSGEKQIIHAVNGVSLTIKQGEILAIAGESGCGKSTLARAVIALQNVKSGEIYYKDENILKMNKQAIKNFRKNVQMIFQNPYASLNPKMKIIDILKEPLKINTDLSDFEIMQRISEIICEVGLDKDCLTLYPHEFSGGQRQRIAIARALVLKPEFILADEPVSALDVSIQAQIINLLRDLKNHLRLTFLLITHDIGIIRYLADRVAVMYLGEIVEVGRTAQVFLNPKHPYTKALLSYAPKIGSIARREEHILSGELPSARDLPTGCKFHTKCPNCMDICTKCAPKPLEIADGHSVTCFLYMKMNK